MRAVIADRPARAADDPWPDVDVVMPIRNEADHLRTAVEAVTSQEYPGTVRIFLAVGPSHDGTERIAEELAAERDDLLVVDNPAGITPSALNAAIAAGRAPVIVRVDGHSRLSEGYIERAVGTMRRTGAVNVGGRQVPVPTTAFEEALAAATTSWLGTGGATYRVGGHEGPVDTVYLGVFDRRAVERVGGFDERLIRNQDYELNIRLRRAGGTVLFDPELSVGYRPRSTWKALARQYYEYGAYKAVVLRMHPQSARLRQLLPPVAVGGVIAGVVVGCRWRPAFLAPVTYLVAISATAGCRAPRGGRAIAAGALATIHAAWAIGLLAGTQMTGGRPARVKRTTVAQRIGCRSTRPRQPDHQPSR